MADPRQAPDDLVEVGPSGYIQVHQAEPTEQQAGSQDRVGTPADLVAVDPDYVARQVDPINPNDLTGFLQRNSQLHQEADAALGLPDQDIQDVDLKDERQRIAWLQIHWIEHDNAERALGI